MVWLTWRQHRIHAAIGTLVLTLLSVVLLATKGDADGYAQAVATCATPLMCVEARDGVAHYVDTSPLLRYLLPALPLLIGVFAGAPLVAGELEQGTHVLGWTQGITRLRWLAVKLALLGSVTLLATGGIAGLVAWWSGPIDLVVGPWPTFDVRGPAPVAYALCVLALGIVAGTTVRHTVGAMALTLLAFVATRLAVVAALRPHYQPPLSALEPFRLGTGARARDWVLSVYPVDHLGHPLRQYMQIVGICNTVPRLGFAACLRDHGAFLRTIYQPSDRFWTFQAIETALFLGLAAGLIGLALWWARRA